MIANDRRGLKFRLWTGLFLFCILAFNVSPPSSAAVTNPPELVADINQQIGVEDGNPDSLVAIGPTVFFSVFDDFHGRELWKSDGTVAGTVLVADIAPGNRSSIPTLLTNINDTVFFVADDGVNGFELWQSDGTSAGTVLVADIAPGNSSSNPTLLTNVIGTLYFTADDGVNGRELWQSDGTAEGTVLVKDIFPEIDGVSGFPNSSFPDELTNVNGTLFFSADDGVNGKELWQSDGTAAGTMLVADILPSVQSSAPLVLTNVNGTLFFVADDGLNGVELWQSDGTSAGTVLVADILAGSGSSQPDDLTNVNGRCFSVLTTASTERSFGKATVPKPGQF